MAESIKRLKEMIQWSDRLGSDELIEIREVIKLLEESKELNRLEIINHGKNIHPEGRFLVIKTKELNSINSVNNIEFQLQDDGKTLKIFIK